MPENHFIAPIAGVQITSTRESTLLISIFGSAELSPDLGCPDCKGKHLRIKAYSVRSLKHGLWRGKTVMLYLKVPKLFCCGCRRYFMAPVRGVLPKKRATEQFRQEVFHLHQGGLPQKNLSITHGISMATVERWYQDFVPYRVKELSGRSCPIVLGIDEHFFTRKHGYATTFADLRNHKVFDVVLGRSEESLSAYLKRLNGRDNVRVVVMDLSETYRSIVKKYFPNAMIVADRFHVVRLLNQHFLKVWGTLDPIGKKSRGLLSLVRRHEWNLKPEQVPKMEMISRRAFGFRNFNNYRLRVIALCSWDGVFTLRN